MKGQDIVNIYARQTCECGAVGAKEFSRSDRN